MTTPARAAWFIPGRIELLGKHVDYLGGRSLTCCTPWGITLTVTRIAGGEPFPGCDDVYARAVATRVTRDFGALRYGAAVEVTSTLPAGAGMSSSSAYVLGLLMALVWANDLTGRSSWRGAGLWRPMAFAEYAAAVEGGSPWGPFPGDEGVGTQGGAQDHVAICANVAGMVGQFSYLPAFEEGRAAWPAAWQLLVAHSGVEAVKTGDAMAPYNRVAAEGRAGQPERRVQFARECGVLVPAALTAIAAGDAAALGAAAAESQAMAEMVLRNQVPETVALVALAREAGAFAASAFGAGFGGAVWAAVPEERAEAVLSAWRAAYEAAHQQAAARAWWGTMRPSGGMAAVPPAATASGSPV